MGGLIQIQFIQSACIHVFWIFCTLRILLQTDGLGFAVRPLLRDRLRRRVFVTALDSKRQAELPIQEQKRRPHGQERNRIRQHDRWVAGDNVARFLRSLQFSVESLRIDLVC